MIRSGRLLTALFCLLLWAVPALAGPRIVVIGDLHGDYAAYLDIVAAAGLADENARWSGRDATLVQMGDVPDRGPDTLRIIRHLQKLEKAAAKGGGRLVLLVGNHEAMNMTGDLRYVSAGEFAAFADAASQARRDRAFELNQASLLAFYRMADPQITVEQARLKWFEITPLGRLEHIWAWSPAGEVGRWVMGHPAIVKLGDILFVHGGLSVETSVWPIEAVNAAVRAALAKGPAMAPSILTDPLGPLWYRGNIQPDAAPSPEDGAPPLAVGRLSIADELTRVLATYGARRLVVAHTPRPEGIVASENGRLIRVDTGISSAYGGVRSYLEIRDGQAVAHEKGKDGRWTSHAIPSPDAGTP
jgi:hypothetical protein